MKKREENRWDEQQRKKKSNLRTGKRLEVKIRGILKKKKNTPAATSKVRFRRKSYICKLYVM